MELNTTITRGVFSITVEGRQCYGSANHYCNIVIVNGEDPGRMSLDQDERDALVAALQSIPRNEG